MRLRSALVRLDGTSVGRLDETAHGCEFRYLSSWLARREAVPISLTLPLRSAPVSTEGLHPSLENLLPEGWLRELSTQKLKISKDDAFGLLVATKQNALDLARGRSSGRR